MKTNWTAKKLGEVCEIFNGVSVPKAEMLSSGKFKILKNRDYSERGIIWENDENGWTDKEVPQNKLIRIGDSLLINAAHNKSHVASKVGYVDEIKHRNTVTSGEVMIIRARTDKILPEVVNLLLHSNEFIQRLKKLVDGIHLYPKDVAKIEISVPPIAEQKKIVEKLEKQFAKIDEAARLRAESEVATVALLPAALHEIFSQAESKGWQEKSLGDFCTIQSGGTPSKSVSSYWNGGDVPWLRSEACRDKAVDHAEKFITQEGLAHSSARIFKARTTLIALVGATIGRTGFLTFESSTNQNIAGLYPKDESELLPEFLFVMARSLYSSFLNIGQGKFKMANLTFIKSLKIPLPPIAEQKEIVKKLDALAEKVRALQALQSQQAADLKTLKQSILHDAFSGKR